MTDIFVRSKKHVISQSLTRDLCVKTINIAVWQWEDGFSHDDKLVGFKNTVILSVVKQSHFAASQSELDRSHCPSQFISRTGPAAACPSTPTGALQSPGDELWSSGRQACVVCSHFLSNKKAVFLSTWIKKAAWVSVIGGLLVVIKREQKMAVPKKIYKRLLYTQLFNQKVRGGDSGSSGQSSANWDPEWSEHL